MIAFLDVGFIYLYEYMLIYPSCSLCELTAGKVLTKQVSVVWQHSLMSVLFIYINICVCIHTDDCPPPPPPLISRVCMASVNVKHY